MDSLNSMTALTAVTAFPERLASSTIVTLSVHGLFPLF